jgi:hypothetical protein
MRNLIGLLSNDTLYRQFKLQYPKYAEMYDYQSVTSYIDYNFMTYMIKYSLHTLLLFFKGVPASFYPEIIKQCNSQHQLINECIIQGIIVNRDHPVTSSDDYVKLLSELVRIGVHPDVLKLDAVYSTLFFRQKKQEKRIENIAKLIAGYKISRYRAALLNQLGCDQ